MPETILDTGVIIGGLGNPNGRPARILMATLSSQSGLLSADLLAEYGRSIAGARATRHHGLPSDDVAEFVNAYAATARLIRPAPGPRCPDPRDQHLWDLLHCAPGAVLVTGETQLLNSTHFSGRVLSPRQFCERYLD